MRLLQFSAYFCRLNQENTTPLFMKRLSIFFLLFGLTIGTFAQTSRPKNLPIFDAMPAHLGYSVGVNVMSFLYQEKDGNAVAVKQNPGININLITSVRLAKYLDFRAMPGIMFGQRDVSVTSTFGTWEAPIESVFIDLPLLLKYRSERVNNFAPYLIAGVNPRVDLTGGEITDGWKRAARIVDAFDVYPELGVGLDFYLEKVKVSTELKFSIGMLNVYKPAEDVTEYQVYNNAFERISSNMVILSFHIE